MTKEEMFNNLIYDGFKDNENYEKLKYSFNRARKLMMQHLVFERAPARYQYDMCMTIYIIAIQSGTKALHNFRIFSKPEERNFDYTLDEYFQPSKTIDVKEVKKIN